MVRVRGFCEFRVLSWLPFSVTFVALRVFVVAVDSYLSTQGKRFSAFSAASAVNVGSTSIRTLPRGWGRRADRCQERRVGWGPRAPPLLTPLPRGALTP